MARLRQFLLLLWKNFKLQICHPWVTLFELGVPTLFSIILVFIRTNVTSIYISEPTIYDPFSIDQFPGNLTRAKIWKVVYSPDDELQQNVMKNVALNLDVDIHGFPDEDSLLQYYSNSSDQAKILAAFVYRPGSEHGTNFSSHISYKIRPRALAGSSVPGKPLPSWLTEYTFPLFQALGPRDKDSGWGGRPGYMAQGFLPLQHALTKSIINVIRNGSVEEELQLRMQRYPYPPYYDDKYLLALQFFFPVVLMLSFIYPSLNIVKSLVVEKEKKLKEAMKMMGLSNWMHWCAWYLKYFLFLSVSIALITVLLSIKFGGSVAVINHSDPSVIFVLLLVYVASNICFCFFLSTLFSKANSAAAGAGIVFFLTFIPYFLIYPRYNDLSLPEKLAACLLSNTALSMSSMVLTMWEGTAVGVQWCNLKIPATPDDPLTMSMVFIMLIVDAVIYIILTWYIEAVFPGDYGVPEHWYFPFTRSFWCPKSPSIEELTQLFNSGDRCAEFFEREPTGLMPGIQVQGLTKTYHKKKPPAVNNISVNMYRGQISVLLGHNGAGKTTTISMLTGLYPPTSGTAIVNGYDICDDIDGVHSGLGICPQHDVLFDDLTVEEHLYFFCKLKGYIADLVPSEIDHIVSAIGLEDKRKAKAKTLSGGMKRKLSVGIALVGGSQVVMLDEPTSGMDPSARRFTWDLLQAEKEDRTILLTTHFMEEADVLGDRIAIMAEGEIQCCGSPLFLKKKYGAGYHLVMVKQPSCDASVITDIIQSYLPAAEMGNNIGTELTYILPHESSHLFEKLFTELEERKEQLKIASYGASITTMEEVFIKVGQKVATIAAAKNGDNHSLSSITDSGVHVLDEDQASSAGSDPPDTVCDIVIEKNTGIALFFQQLLALLLKRILYTGRNWVLTLSQLFLPPFFLILTLIILKTLPKPRDSPALELNLEPFDGTIVPYAVNSTSAVEAKMAELFASQFNPQFDQPLLVAHSHSDLINELIKQGSHDVGQYNLHNIVAGSFIHGINMTNVTSLYNNQAYHSPAIALLAMDNALLKYFGRNESYSLSLINHPLPRTLAEKGKQLQTQATEAYQISQNLMFGMSFLISSFAIFIVRESSSKSKHLQSVSGVNLFTFWLATFLWDFLCYLVPCVFVLFVFLAFQTDGMSSAEEQGRLLLIFFIHGLSALPFIYCLSFLFKLPSTAYVRLCLFNIVGGIACLLTVTILEIPQLGVQYVARALDWLFSILLPNYCLGRSVSNLFQNNQFNKICNFPPIFCTRSFPLFDVFKPCCHGKCDDVCIPWVSNYFSMDNPGIGKQLIFLVLQALFFTLLLTACELKLFRYLKYKLNGRKIMPLSHQHDFDPSTSLTGEDDDVSAERQRILNTPSMDLFASNRLVLKELTKYYGSLLAVNKLTLGIPKGECFGLLGLNGAGKTTTFKMITGDEAVSSGDIILDGYSVQTDIRKVQRRLGYCPQFDGLIDQLTGRETLTLFARLRGMKESSIATHVTKLSTMLSFGMHVDKQVKEYSGGNKRKLSTAIALIGDTPMVFLDEPTTGMDPVSRRCLWDALLRVLRSGRSIVLTSHSMEECEALCNRLVIMVNGKLCCLGSPQHLKNKFGQGFTLMAKVGKRLHPTRAQLASPVSVEAGNDEKVLLPIEMDELTIFLSDVDQVKSYIERTFSGCVLKDVHEGLLHYHIPNPRLSWAQIFGAMEQAKQVLNIEDYSVGQTTLEQVFLNFARAQRAVNDL